MSGRSRRGRGGKGGGGFMGRLLSTRLEEYGRSADLDDLDGAVAYLCHTFPEYRRQKQGAFSKQVGKVAAALMEDLRLQKMEEKHLNKKHRNCDGSASNSTSEWSDRQQEGSKGCQVDSSDGEFNSDAVMDEDQNERLNSSLRTLYGISTASKGVENSAYRQAADGEPIKIVQSQKTELAGVRDGSHGQARQAKNSGVETSRDARKSKSQKSRKRETEGGTALTKPEKKKPKRMMSAGKHLTLAKTAMTVPKPVRYSDLGGIEDVLQDIKELIEYPLGHPEVYTWLGVEPPRGMLLHGPPGCGKTALANAIANECNVPFFRVSAPEIVSGMSGESEAKIRNLFRDAAASAPSIIFIDEIDSIAQKRENAQREMERRIVAQLLTCMDDLSGAQTVIETPNLVGDEDGPGQASNPDSQTAQDGAGNAPESAEKSDPQTGGHVIILGATNRPDALDPALRRAGRFDREISLGIPNEAARMRILSVMCKKLRLEGNFDFGAVARKTPGFVGADLEALAKEAAAVAITRIFSDLESNKVVAAEKGDDVGSNGDARPEDMMVDEGSGVGAGAGAGATKSEVEPFKEEELSGLAITMADFEAAVPKVQPSVRREGFTTTPDVTWADVGSLEDVREELSFAITQPILTPERFESLGMSFACGVLLFGPPGCGKTLVAKAVANDAGANFMSIKGPELLNKYVGESERAVRQLFSRARAAKPCVLFFDEMDALAPRRGSDNQAAERVVNQLLTEMDGIDSREGVYLVAATNRPDIIDPALLRPGRLDKMLYVPLPDPAGRVSILEALMKKTPLGEGVSPKEVGLDQRCTGFSGADLAGLVREACIMALKETIRLEKQGATVVGRDHFEAALATVKPSVSKEDQKLYAKMHATLRRSRAHIQRKDDEKEG
ncbi:hypothetical protein BSKO_10145 [Bryopsis sp. KO-2023]|nr:hypothetical protein BSKO_10145 [Bryopsis sp. KO-2023]